MEHPRPWHRDSFFTAPRRPLTRDQRRIWLARLELRRRSRAITTLHVEIGRALLRRLGEDGRLDPGHDTLAEDAGCCPRTVREALRRLRNLGMVKWLRRLIRTRQGVRQTSNAYQLRPDGPAPTTPIRCDGRTYRETTPLRNSEAPPSSFNPAAAAVLAQIRERRTFAVAELLRKGRPVHGCR